MAERGILEVDTPLLQSGPNCDHGITPFSVGDRFLVTSPEHPLKRLVAAGYGDVYSLSPCFRADECGRRHEPEFTMLEWYRVDLPVAALAEECIDCCEALLGTNWPRQRLSYAKAFERQAGLDPFTCSAADLRSRLGRQAPEATATRAELLDLALVTLVEPALGCEGWTLLTDYPGDQAAQATQRFDDQGRLVAERFELYRQGIELANGYQECSDVAAIGARFDAATCDEHRDEAYLAALAAGLPTCSGVALGFDRLVMLATGVEQIDQVKAFGWKRA